MNQWPDPLSAWWRDRYPQRNFLDPDEVAVNRHGEITPAQRASLNMKLAEESIEAFLFMLIGIGLWLFVGIILIISLSAELPLATYVWGVILYIGAWLLGLPGVVKGARIWSEFFAARREIATNKIVQAEGEVVWTGDIYAAKIGSRRLKPIYNKLNLPPAHYRFFYLRGGRWLLSAEKLSSLANMDTESQLLQILAKVNRFSRDDLLANQSGRSTARQRMRLGWKFCQSLVKSSLLSLIAIELFNLGWAQAQLDFISRNIFNALIFALLAALSGTLALALDLIRGRVASVEGLGQRHKTDSRQQVYTYCFGKLRFKVSGQAYNALLIGAAYRVYYTPSSKQLLSIEPAN